MSGPQVPLRFLNSQGILLEPGRRTLVEEPSPHIGDVADRPSQFRPPPSPLLPLLRQHLLRAPDRAGELPVVSSMFLSVTFPVFRNSPALRPSVHLATVLFRSRPQSSPQLPRQSDLLTLSSPSVSRGFVCRKTVFCRALVSSPQRTGSSLSLSVLAPGLQE